MGSLFSKTTPPGEQGATSPKQKRQTTVQLSIAVAVYTVLHIVATKQAAKNESNDVTSSDSAAAVTSDVIVPTETVTTSDVTSGTVTSTSDVTETATSTNLTEAGGEPVPEASEETASESPVDVVTTEASLDVAHVADDDSPTSTQITDTESPAVSHEESNTECTASEEPGLTNVDRESDNSSSKVETVEPSSQTHDTETNTMESDSSESDTGIIVEGDQDENSLPENITGEDHQHPSTELEHKLEEMNLKSDNSLPEVEESIVSGDVTSVDY